MATKILVTTTFAAALCLAACSPAETSGEGQTPTESADSMSTDVRSVAITDMSKVSILTHSFTIPPWYRDDEDTDATGVFTAGDCSDELGANPAFAIHESPEIGLCANQSL